LDASVVVAGLASADATGEWAESVLAGEPLAAPHLMPVEAASILRRNAVEAELGELRDQYQSLRQQADRLAAASQRLQTKIIDLRLRQKEGRPAQP
jgi:predicted nucleic acid-binding protein